MQKIIAVIFDFDLTLTPEFMQKPIFNHYNIDESDFWNKTRLREIQWERKGINLDQENSYLNQFLENVRDGIMLGLSNQKLKDFGKEINFFPGVETFFDEIKNIPEVKNKKIKLEFYVISTGFKKMIEGSKISKHFKEIYAAELTEKNGEIYEIARAVGFTNKTRYIYQIRKGPKFDVNKKVKPHQIRIPIDNMIYIGDGFTDVPCFAVMNKQNGYSIGVYNPKSESSFKEIQKLDRDGRLHAYTVANYQKDSELFNIIKNRIKDLASSV
jgi:phosphoserine phosphatase